MQEERKCKNCGCDCHCKEQECPQCPNDVCAECDCKTKQEEIK